MCLCFLLFFQRELLSLTDASSYQECDRSNDSVWSEYRFRILTTSLMRELSHVHQLDFLQGRLVAYVTCPLIPRGFTVLLMDHGVHNMVKKWKQDIHFAIPHYLATRYRTDAVVRVTLFFYKSKNYQYTPISAVPVSDAAASSGPLDPSAPRVKPVRPFSPITGFVDDLYTDPLRIGECLIDLMSVREVSNATPTKGDSCDANEEKDEMDHEAAQQKSDALAVLKAEEEEERSAHPGAAKNATAKSSKTKPKTKKQIRAEEKERQRTEWHAKWIPIVSSVKMPFPNTPTPASASGDAALSDDSASLHVIRQPSICVNVKRVVLDRSKLYKPTATGVKVYFPLFGLSLIDAIPEEVAYLSIAGVGCQYNDSQWQTTVSATIASLQLDDLRRHAVFPVLFNPTILPADETPQPFIQLALNQKKAPNSAISIFPYFNVLVQKMDVRVDELNIWKGLEFLNRMLARSGGVNLDLDTKLHTRVFEEFMLPPNFGTQKMYFKMLQVQPLAINVSFASNPGQRQQANYQINPFYTFLNMLQAGIANVNDAPLRLNGKMIDNAIGTKETIIWSLVSHYIQQGLVESYKIFGSVEFLGNPVGLANDIGTSAMDFFVEPAKGLMISPEAFGSGLAKGSSALLKGTIGGLMGSVSAVTNSAGKAMATATGDEAFMANQAAAKNQKQPEHLGDGLKMGITAFGSSLVSGVTGVFLDPLAGAKKEGILGFGKVTRHNTHIDIYVCQPVSSVSFVSLVSLSCLFLSLFCLCT